MSPVPLLRDVGRCVLMVPTVVGRELTRAALLPFMSFFIYAGTLRALRDRTGPFRKGAFLTGFYLYFFLVAAVPFIFVLQWTGKDMAQQFMFGVMMRDDVPTEVNVHRMVSVASRIPGFSIKNGELRPVPGADGATVVDPVSKKAEFAFRTQEYSPRPEDAARLTFGKRAVTFREDSKESAASYDEARNIYVPALLGLRLTTGANLPFNLYDALNVAGALAAKIPAMDFTRAGTLAYDKPPDYKPAPGPMIFSHNGRDLLSLDLRDETPYARTRSPALISVSADTIFYRRDYDEAFDALFLPSLKDGSVSKKLNAFQRSFRRVAIIYYWIAATALATLCYVTFLSFGALMALPATFYLKPALQSASAGVALRGALLTLLFCFACFCAFPFFFIKIPYVALLVAFLYYGWFAYRMKRLSAKA
ncbi:MAG: hypothetical protein ABW189_09520 [Rickettsiales bacterium]